MSKTTTQINKEAHNSDVDSPAVIAYRLGQVEAAVRDGFKAHDAKLDGLTSNFISKEEFTTVTDRIKVLETSKGRDWVWKTLSAAAGAALALLVAYSITGHLGG